jgi:hypothetical protein
VEHVQGQFKTNPVEATTVEATTDEGYRTVSGLAVLALATGFLSVVAFVHPLLWSLPIAAIGLAIGALWHIRQHPREAVGRNAALLGMSAAVFFGCGAVSYSFAREIWLVERSRQAADHFLSLLAAGQAHQAHQLTRMPSSRLPSNSDFESALAADPEGAKAFERFLKGDLIQRLHRTESLPQFERGRLANYDMRAEYTELEYLLKDGDVPDRMRVVVEFARNADTGQEQWRIAQIGAIE